METGLLETISRAKGQLLGFFDGVRPVCGIILGSGLGSFADTLCERRFLPFGSVCGMRASTATSHVGRFVLGQVCDGGPWVLCMQGRLHGYEGYSPQEVAFPVWLMHACGIDTLVTTNAAGAVNERYSVGDFCLMADHINLTGRNPVCGTEANELAPRFFSMKDAYDPRLRAIVRNVAAREHIALQEGVYLGLLGPSFETPAEIRMARTLGADTVAMSVVEEVIAARHVGMRVAGLSLVSNMACGIQGASPTDEEVLDVAAMRAPDFCRLVQGVICGL